MAQGLCCPAATAFSHEVSSELSLLNPALCAISTLRHPASLPVLQAASRYSKVANAISVMKPTLLGFDLTSSGSAGASLHLLALLNPASRIAQRVAPMLQWLRQWLGVSMRVVLNPVPDLNKPPLSSYYRYVLPVVGEAGGLADPLLWWYCFSQACTCGCSKSSLRNGRQGMPINIMSRSAC